MRLLPRILLFITGLLSAGIASGVLPLRDQWQAACHALGAGNAGKAVELFREFDHWYGSEPQVMDPDFREGFLRLHGLAAIETGAFPEAARLLETWFSENETRQAFRAFLRFQLIHVYQALAEPIEAGRHRLLFLEEHPELPECALIRWEWAEEALGGQEFDRARSELEKVLGMESLPPSGQILASAALAMIDLAEGAGESALQRLSAPVSGESAVVLGFWRSVMAPALADHLLRAGLPGPADQAAQWFSSKESLAGTVSTFRERMNRRIGSSGPAGARQSLWNAHWQRQLDRLENSLHGNHGQGATKETLYTLRLRSLLESDKPVAAAILAQGLLESPSLSSSIIRTEAYKSVIEASLALEKWGRAEDFVDRFLADHPQDPALPEILFLSGRLAAARKDWQAALNTVETLIKTWPTHAARPSWQVLQGDWLLRAGKAEIALKIFLDLASTTPSAWLPFINFQQARCRIALERHEEAAAQLLELSSQASAPGSLRETALTELLKLHFKCFNAQGFQAVLESYRRGFPEGLNTGMVGNLAGSFAMRSGNLVTAIHEFQAVAAGSGPVARYAREQLSSIFRMSGDTGALRSHALQWIRQGIQERGMVPDTPLQDCLVYQKVNGQPALTGSLLKMLVESIENQPLSLLEVISACWEDYRTVLGASGPLLPWIEANADAAFRDGRLARFALWQVYAANLLDAMGRNDSADTRRIRVIQSLHAGKWPEAIAFIVARTAHAYDFPEAAGLFEDFLERHPGSPHRPEALFRLAGLMRGDQLESKGYALLQEVVSEWMDSPLHSEACLELARWSLEDGHPLRAAHELAVLLERDSLPVRLTAEALYLRARSDFQTGNPERAFLGCFRIVNLYPDLHDISGPARNLLVEKFSELPDGTLREAVESRLAGTGMEHDQPLPHS